MSRPSPVPPEPPADFDVAAFLPVVAGGLAAAPNVILQLATPGVGYGVLESKVHSGNVMIHPIKRLRTTMTYLAVALLGTDEERAAYREAVNTAHRQVRSTASSPVEYNAFDVRLQLWVAACLYWGLADLHERLHGPMDGPEADAFYQYAARLGTTLQVRADMWPPDRAAFDRYWSENLAATTVSPAVRAYLRDLVDLKMLPLPVQLLLSRPHRYLVAGMLPPHVRDQMGLRWTPRDEWLLSHTLRLLGHVDNALPYSVRRLPLSIYLSDLRFRRKHGLPLV
ncbi:oxygenase MpaB family protein [Nocardia asteroides]|uniref:oxygenase MpaB family protein n=1 Tax=Nocardia asteroides TaxID=1824 RepID=UPI001E6296A9|nr:oxygenase MpaB family protein [Nocardia asteroides]UGT64237.1 oxygenase MpaB family protein [Nocardia asteroides]